MLEMSQSDHDSLDERRCFVHCRYSLIFNPGETDDLFVMRVNRAEHFSFSLVTKSECNIGSYGS